jgi:glycosyltransferase involved in cell wall biosynthesis
MAKRVSDRLRLIISGDWLLRDPAQQRELDRQFEQFGPDLVWVEAGHQILYALQWRRGVPVIVDFWGTSEGAERDLHKARGLSRAWHRYHCMMAHRNERRLVPRLASAVVVSEHLASHLRSVVPRAPVCVVPTALVDRDESRAVSTHHRETTIILTGSMSFPPNVDAACHFVNDILPRIAERVPEVEVVIAGNAPAPAVHALAANPRVEVTGPVPDLQSLIGECAVYAQPLRLGSGIRTKLLEVFPTGTPLVTSSTGAEGYDLRHGDNAMVADTPEAFADACVQLLGDRELREKMGGAMRTTAQLTYTQRTVRDRIASTVSACLGTKQRA